MPVPAPTARGFRLALDIAAADGGGPLFVRIARALSADIRRGRLGPETRLPGSRALADSLGVHRNTVLAAYRELLAEGWIESQPGRGTFVSTDLRDAELPVKAQRAKPTPAARSSERIGFAFGARSPAPPYRPVAKGVLRMLGGLPDLRLVPNEAFARAQRRTLRHSSEILGYGDPAGHPRLRSALADMLRNTRGLVASSEDVLITRGSQMALSLVACALIAPGDVVAVEALGYQPAFAALRQAGARLVPIAVDEQGLNVPLLAALIARERVRAIYLTPHHQYPTTVQLAPARRLELLALAARARIAVLEDDYDHEFHYEGRPLLPLASSDEAGVVIYIGTLSKVFAPGIRVGYVIAPRPLLSELTHQRFYLDRQGDHVTECALAELIEDGELARHTRRTRRVYQARRDRCATLLEQHFGAALQFQRPNGGMALWARVDRAVDTERWVELAEREGVLIQGGRQFRLDESETPYVRLGYAALDERELAEAVRRLKRAFHKARR
ncbi:MAG TPA: PLP-dependent aminotransferase family protein [Polyangiales bacterium]|nr:PLP-dependent aminotransferase family protein [Polyangiales bacterium]